MLLIKLLCYLLCTKNLKKTKDMMNRVFVSLLIILISGSLYAQSVKQQIKGKILDAVTNEPLIGATIVIEDVLPTIGTITDIDGAYGLENVPVGRHVVVASFIGYKSVRIPEILVSSAKAFNLDVELEEESLSLNSVTITGRAGKESYNSMAPVSARSFTIEESSRLAGGLSDPARVAYNFAGVTFSSPQDNGVIIRGNSPTSVLWRLNGMDVSGAAHFGGGNMAGAGLISIYSSNILSGSDFFTGAFPSEFSNGTSGVFDIKFRKGNNEEHKHLAQLGILDLDLASEGPINKEKGSSYLVNYRHGFLGYYGAMVDGTEPHFKDFSFSLNFPTEKYGEFTFWGIGGLSSLINPVKRYKVKEDKIKYREFFDHFLDKDISFGMGIVSLNHKLRVGKSSFLRSTVGYTTNYYNNDTRYFVPDADTLNSGVYHQHENKQNLESKFELSSVLYSKISPRLTNKTGIRGSLLMVDAFAEEANEPTNPLTNKFDINKSCENINLFTHFKYDITKNLDLNVGVATTKFSLANEYTFEPRVGLKWKYLPSAHVSFAYGRHSKREELKNYYFNNPITNKPNDLLLSKADHYVASFGFQLSDNVSLTIEGYYQHLFDVPVVEGDTYSFANYTTLWNIKGTVNNKGTGTNKGVDFTLERSMVNGFYYLLTASVYDSKYKDAQNVERNTLFNRNFMTTLAVGKEFLIKGKNLLGFNLNATYMNGSRFTPYLEKESLAAKEVVYDKERMYENQDDPEVWLNFGITYKINKANHTSTWGFDFQNALLTEQMEGYKYNFRTKSIDADKVLFLIPNLYYRIEF